MSSRAGWSPRKISPAASPRASQRYAGLQKKYGKITQDAQRKALQLENLLEEKDEEIEALAFAMQTFNNDAARLRSENDELRDLARSHILASQQQEAQVTQLKWRASLCMIICQHFGKECRIWSTS